MKRLVALFCFTLTILWLVSPHIVLGQELVVVEKFQWTDTVDRSTRQYGKIFSSPVKTKELYLWMQFKGSPELLEKLKSSPDGKFLIRHEWYRYGPDRINADHYEVIELSVGRKEDLHKLRYEVDAKGYFYWRLWSGKKQLSRGWWRVDIVDGSGNILQCADGEKTKPCQLSIRVE